MKNWVRTVLGVLALTAVSLLPACESMSKTDKGPGWCPVCKEYHDSSGRTVAHPEPAKAAAPAPAPRPSDGRSVTYLPTGIRETSVIMIERIAPTEVVLGQPFDYEIRVTNLTRNALDGVILTDQCASNFKLESATPAQDSIDGNTLRWNLGAMAPGEVKSVKVRGSATSTDPVQHCLSAQYDMSSCMAINVVQPALKLAMTATAEALKCDPVAVKYTVTNSGTGVARNVVVKQTLPKGLTTADGKDSISVAIGDLAAGQSKEINASLAAGATGKFDHAASATADGNLKADASASTVLKEPVLAIECSAPEKQFIGRSVTYEATVTNNGDGVARNAVADITLPAGVSVINATAGGTAAAGKVSWNLGDLAPKASKKIAVTVGTSAAAKLTSTASASAYCAKPVNCSKTTDVMGIPAVLLEVVDESDPIEVGGNETYVITVTNQGSAADTNIKIVATLEDAMGYVSSSGATAGTAAGKTVTFAPLASLAPKAQATWKVVVKANAAGDVRFKVTMNTDQLGRPVEETEATNFYK